MRASKLTTVLGYLNPVELVGREGKGISRRNSLISILSPYVLKIPSIYLRPRYHSRNHPANGDAIQDVFPDRPSAVLDVDQMGKDV